MNLYLSGEDFKELKRLYAKAKPGEVFLFKGQEVLKEYAKYMIEYIENSMFEGTSCGKRK
jgi:hypothetical protein